MIVGIKFILDKTRDWCKHFIARIEYGFQSDIQRTGGAAGHDDVFIGYRCTLFFGKIFGHRSANHRIPGVGHIAVIIKSAGVDCFPKNFIEFFRRRNIRISQAEIIDVFSPIFGFEPGTLLKHFTNERRSGDYVFYFF